MIKNSTLPTGEPAQEVRIDLHVHSRFSDRPYSWFMRSAHSAECYTTPAAVYATAKARGMNLVTLCDHDTIDGALELCAQADDTFISEEVSARFPEDGCIVHTIVLDISEIQHSEIQRLRGNIYELVSYLHHQSVEFLLCHPLSQVNRRLHKDHLERCLLMFRNLELRNGTRDAAHEEALRAILAGLTPAMLQSFAERHPHVPFINRDGRYGLVGGSDDHAGLSIARAYTTFVGERSGAGVTAALRARRTEPAGQHGTTRVLQHNVYGVIGGYLQHDEHHHDGDDRRDQHDHHDGDGEAADRQTASSGAGDAPLAGLGPTMIKYVDFLDAAQEADGPVDWTELPARGHTDPTQAQLATLVESVLVRSSREAWTELAAPLMQAQLAAFADKLPAVVKAITVSLPAILGARWHGHDIQSARRYSADLGVLPRSPGNPRVAVLTDTIDDINGVALGLRRLRDAAAAAGHDLFLVACGDGDHVTTDGDGIIRVPSILRHRLADYPDMEFALPHLPSLVTCLLDQQIDLVQVSTPGPMGAMGLLAARTLCLPIVGQFHTDLPEYGTRITGDPMVGTILAKLCGWLYGAMDRVFAPSQAVARRLRELGVVPDKVARLPRGVDLELFSPARRQARAPGEESAPTAIYVGRLSREKGLDALVDGFALAAPRVPGARLQLVGDGPDGDRLRARAGGAANVIFLGARRGPELAALMASADLFVSTSETETFGNTVVEAQASGLPVIVANRGAASENMRDGITGLAVDGRRPEEIAAALGALLGDARARARMGQAAVVFARRYDMKRAAEGTFLEYRRFLDERALAATVSRAAAAHPPPPSWDQRPGASANDAAASAVTATATAVPGADAERVA
ncbi:MAG TPA: glycosyltransferase [Polyangia bacterium]|nr:glycosyltransferase [Polyangia bacterium]